MIYKILLFLSLFQIGISSQTKNLITYEVPFKIKENLFDFSNPETLGLNIAEGTETFTIFSPEENDNKYNNGVVLIPFKGYLYAQWQSSEKDEDAADTKVFYSRSSDGITWSDQKPIIDGFESGFYTSGGWWTIDDTLIAYLNIWRNHKSNLNKSHTLFISSADGINWSEPMPVMDVDGDPVNGIIEQDPHRLPDGRIIGAFHLQPGLKVSPFFTDDPGGTKGWINAEMENLPYFSQKSRAIEPSLYCKNDGTIVMVFRDQEGSFKKLASVSTDRGETWTKPVITDFPDCRAKQSAGNLPGGSAYQVGCPSGCKSRFPLTITLSKEGNVFNRAFLLRSGGADLQPLRYKGKYKREGYNYPKSVVWNGYLYVGYATNKEDVELTRIPLNSLKFSD